MTIPAGVFFSLDGLDGCGKSTQCRLLAHYLRSQGNDVILCRDPGGTAVGDRIREVLLDRRNDMTPRCEALLYMASRAQLVEEIIRPALTAGKIVISDRFLLATIAYQGYAGGLPIEHLWEIGRLAAGDVLPDLTLILDLSAEIAAARLTGPADRMESRGLEFHNKVRDGFLVEAAKNPERIKVIDATVSIDEVQKAIRQEVAHVLGGRRRP